MSEPSKDTQKALAVRPATEAYEVGYGKPPEQSRFKPGQSGNPRGRPRGSKNRKPKLNEERLKEIILQEAYRTIKVNDGPRQVTVPMAQAVVRSLAHNAVKGNTRAQRLFSEMLASTEAQNRKLMEDYFASAIDYKQQWEAELERRRVRGITAPDPIPHPDHVVLDPRDGTVRIKGPMTREEKEVWDRMIAGRKDYKEELASLEADLENPEMQQYRKQIEDDIRHTKKILSIIENAIGPEDE